MMEEERLDIEQIFRNAFSGQISSEEQQILDSWLIDRAENQRYYAEQKKLWDLLQLHQKMQKIDEHKAYQKISSQLFNKKKPNLVLQIQRVAAILLLPVLIFTGITYFQNNKRNQSPQVYHTAETPLGMRSSLILPDGTKVWLNAGSKLSYPVTFSEKFRTVSLSGEAYFEVKKHNKWPFMVNSGNMKIIVSGTSFNCNAYPENSVIETVLVEGLVTLKNQSSTVSKELRPGELAIFKKNTQQVTKTKTDLQKYVAWKTGKLMFRDDKMNLVVEKLERWYNVDFEIKDKEIADYIYTATFIDESLDQVLKMLSLSAPIRYTVLERKKQDDQSFTRQVVRLYKKKH